MRNETMNNQYDVAALFDGGWRSTDKEELMTEYELTEEEAEEIFEELKAYEQ